MQFAPRVVCWIAAPAVALSVAAVAVRAQDSTTTVAVGQQAPEFTASGATRYGLLKDSVRLSDLRGQTVVLAFFFKARTKG